MIAPLINALRLPSRAMCRPALAGHFAESKDYYKKLDLCYQFYSSKISGKQKEKILVVSKADFVITNSDFSAWENAPLKLEWQNRRVKIWRVLKDQLNDIVVLFPERKVDDMCLVIS